MNTSTTTIPRTVRFNPSELKRIEEFLELNQFLDFSNLTRIAIAAFIRNPMLRVQTVKEKKSTPQQARKRNT